MKEYPKKEEQHLQQVNDHDAEYKSHQDVEDKRLEQHMRLSDIEKYKLFRRMLRIGKMLASAKITHQS
ncbi:hypothetical protein [Pseudoflavitalea rhizosphaerae]|uniref:hypothetical protein n=1 Tax=Pseudoflavitalea rhizosphaerae TaxID=1884793 RepID=UPI000F8D3E76|nr:hypothetical protein [Pseudoflavitalea rhizosphaerae]